MYSTFFSHSRSILIINSLFHIYDYNPCSFRTTFIQKKILLVKLIAAWIITIQWFTVTQRPRYRTLVLSPMKYSIHNSFMVIAHAMCLLFQWKCCEFFNRTKKKRPNVCNLLTIVEHFLLGKYKIRRQRNEWKSFHNNSRNIWKEIYSTFEMAFYSPFLRISQSRFLILLLKGEHV